MLNVDNVEQFADPSDTIVTDTDLNKGVRDGAGAVLCMVLVLVDDGIVKESGLVCQWNKFVWCVQVAKCVKWQIRENKPQITEKA